ncbi:MAG TPA: citrate (Si)-synthase, eukaryotic [Bacteroidia bacterium]|nr:citrate (Si)-synthase, eukaryotic [Bacteroidia bacterium]QQR94538.1 MAG: citrate (Si)-synthase, eukaryotic [Bacteroidota bacterium]MBP7714120.1 citrate (Si)-synthase, eukaryotic [Bacteroidia bacterium]MBP8669407.1 citrate (Si)-synthase, eukaryotic [Bacteroidia bacterium]HOZ82519.1 citrate (Si)-synthase, eukaryotic [Bacteroidia bacterium]
MDNIKEKFKEKALPMAGTIKDIVKTHGNFVLGQYTVEQVYQGMKGMIGMVTETSKLDANEGIRFRGYSIPELREKLPVSKEGPEPLPEGIFYLLLTGEMPLLKDVIEVNNEWMKRATVPKHVFDMLDMLPDKTHPMTQFSMAIMALQTESVFARKYREGMNKKDYWDPMYEDVMNLIARLPRIAAYIYRSTYKDGKHIEPDPKLDWAGNFAHMLGFEELDFRKLMRLYLTIHADHEGGNVSAHATHLVGSALSDPYLSLAAGMNGLAGPLHGLAAQEVARWIIELRDKYNGVPSREQLGEFIKTTLAEGKVVPGYGHAVLRKTDPRYTAQQDFAKKYMADDELFKIVQLLYDVTPEILKATGKIKNPWPNVDAHSGILLMHYGLVEYDFYTVLFGVSRAIGVLTSLLWDRALGMPIERPSSVTTQWIQEKIKSGDAVKAE